MRILLLFDFPPDPTDRRPPGGPLAEQLIGRGHQVRCLLVDCGGDDQRADNTRRIVCRVDDPQADLQFKLPGFGRGDAFSQPFADLTDVQLGQYRDALRRALDDEVHRFDPQVIHAQHVWLFGQLALETGVPYVVSVGGPEIVAALHDARFFSLAEQAAENAGRVLIASEAMRRELLSTFEVAAERILMLRDRPHADMAANCLDVYEAVLDERFGTHK